MLKKYWLLELSIFFISLISLIIIGIYWLWLNHLLWIWLSLSILMIIIVLMINNGLNYWSNSRKKNNPQKLSAESNTELALRDLQLITDNIKTSNPDLLDIAFYFDTLYQVVRTIAGRFYPEQKNAYLEINIPYSIKVVELIAHDVRLNLLDSVPGSHIISLGQIVAALHYGNKGRRLYVLFRKLTLGTTLESAILGNIRNRSKTELRDWFVELYVQKIGHYAIEIYNGKQRLDEDAKSNSQEDQQPELKVDYTASKIIEPLRILVLGQTGSGKSSCINALFGEFKTKVDVLPMTKGVTAYLLYNSELEETIILDSEGYGYDGENLVNDASQEILRCDMILLMVSAVDAARVNDYRVIRQIQALYANLPNKPQPPIIVALTHIDQLRPMREWKPPYNIAKPDNAKALSIRTAMQIVAEELKIGMDQIAPICMKSCQHYNFDEGLIPTILQHLDRAKQLRYLRCIDRYQKEDYWRRLWRQSKNAGRFIAREAYRLTI